MLTSHHEPNTTLITFSICKFACANLPSGPKVGRNWSQRRPKPVPTSAKVGPQVGQNWSQNSADNFIQFCQFLLDRPWPTTCRHPCRGKSGPVAFKDPSTHRLARHHFVSADVLDKAVPRCNEPTLHTATVEARPKIWCLISAALCPGHDLRCRWVVIMIGDHFQSYLGSATVGGFSVCPTFGGAR